MSHPSRANPGDPIYADDWNDLVRRAEQSVGDGSLGEQSFGATGGTWTPPRRYQAMLVQVVQDAVQLDGPCDGDFESGPIWRTEAQQLVALHAMATCLVRTGPNIRLFSTDALSVDDIVIAVYDVGTARWWAFSSCSGSS